MKLGYIIPEWPGQTHLWIWREICHLREWGVDIRIFSTRFPPERDKGRHAWCPQAAAETTYLWPIPAARILWLLLSNFLRNPIGFVRCVALALTLPVESRPRWKAILPMILPACYLAQQVRRDGIGHLHSHAPANSTIICMMVKRLTGVPFSQMVNANLEWWGGAMREKFREARFTTFCTKWMVEQMRRDYADVDPATYGLCRVGVDARKWKPLPAADGASIPPGDGDLRLLTVSRLVKSKGQDDLLKAVALLKQRGVRARLRIGGDGPERVALTQLATELNIGADVDFLGSLSEERYYEEMTHADVFVLASHREPMGVVYMEAMATARATVGTDAGGVPEIITSRVDGMLVPPFNPEALADVLAELAGDVALRRALGAAGRRTVVEQFDSRLWAADMHRRFFGRLPDGYAPPGPAGPPVAAGSAAVGPAPVGAS